MTPPDDDDRDDETPLPAPSPAIADDSQDTPVAVTPIPGLISLPLPPPVRLPRARSEPAAPLPVLGDADASAPMTAPEAAALEAARIVSEHVDINTPTGAVIAAHAAAEAAAEAPKDDSDEEFDPVQVAAAAINRLRRRAQTDLAELRGHYDRHDILVLVLAFVMIIVAGRIHRQLVTPPTVAFEKFGLTFERSTAWLPPESIPASPPRIMRDLNPPAAGKDENYYHVELTSSIEPTARTEVLIEQAPQRGNAVSALDLERRTRWGELYMLDSSTVASIAGVDWLRTEYRFANTPQKGDVPRIERAIEYAAEGKYTPAATDKDKAGDKTLVLHYVVTLTGSPAELERMEEVLAPSLRIESPTGRQFASQSNPLSRMTYPSAVERAFDSTVLIVVADLVDGRLVASGGGSGVIVGGDGSVLTNFHVLNDHDTRLHDVFVIGRFAQRDHAPQLICAGRPSRSKLQREVDLALIKCDLDLDGRSWSPQSGPGVWATLPEGHSNDIKVGQHIWVLGYPDVGFGGLTLATGNVTGWSGVDNTPGRDYFALTTRVSNGNSGGPIVDDSGHLIGIASAYRSHTASDGKLVVQIEKTGLARPLSSASDLLAIAAAGWVPREGHTEVDLTPSAIEAPAAAGSWLQTRIVDAANEAPIADALVTVLRPGVDYDVNRRDDLVLAWGKSNSAGEVILKQRVPIPGTYTVMVVARGYEPLIGKDALHLEPNTPSAFDPWGKIWLRSR